MQRIVIALRSPVLMVEDQPIGTQKAFEALARAERLEDIEALLPWNVKAKMGLVKSLHLCLAIPSL